MASETRAKSIEGSELGNGFTNDTDSNAHLFLAASLQFLHRLLAERTLQCVQVDDNGIPTSGLKVEEDMKEEKSTTRQLYSEQIDQIEEYKRQLRSMEHFLSTIQLDAEKPSAHVKADCKEMVDKTDCNVYSSESLCASTYLYSHVNDDEFSEDIPERVNINISEMKGPKALSSTVGKTTPGAAGDFSGHLPTHHVVLENHRIQSSASYADIVRNAVSGLTRNCGKRRESWRKKRPAKRWLLRPGITENSKEVRRERGSEREVQAQFSSGKGSDSPREVPLRVQLAMGPDASPRKPVTLLVKVPNTIFNLLNRKISKRDTQILSSETSTETQDGLGLGKRKRRLTSVFQNLLKGKTVPSSTTFYSRKEKSWGPVMLAEETDNNAETQDDDTSRNTLVYTLQKSASCNPIGRQTDAELFRQIDNEPVADPRRAECASRCGVAVSGRKSVNGNEKLTLNLSPRVIGCETKRWNGKPAGSTQRQLADDKVLRPEMMSNETELIRSLAINYLDEKIIPLRYSKGSPELSTKRGGISQRDVNTFLKLAAEMRNKQVYRDADSKDVEIPVEIKTMDTPLRLHKTQNIAASFSGGRDFHPETEGPQAMSNEIEKEQLLQMLVGTLPEGPYLPQSKVNRDSQELDTKKNRPEDHIQHLKNNENSALEVLLRHIATGSSTCCARQSAAEQDTTVQTAPKRQLSKISVCSYSSESLSGSDHETPEVEIKDSTISEDEYRVYNHVVINNKPKGPDNEKYFPSYKTNDQNYTPSCVEVKVAIDNSEQKYAAGGKIQYSSRYLDTAEIESLDLHSRKNLITHDISEANVEQGKRETAVEARAMGHDLVANGKRTCLSVRETEKMIFCNPDLSNQVFGQRKELADAMISWWGPQINYSTTPSSQTQLSAYSVSINNLM